MTGECPAHRALTRRRLPHPRGPTLLHFFEAQNTQIGLVFFHPSISTFMRMRDWGYLWLVGPSIEASKNCFGAGDPNSQWVAESNVESSVVDPLEVTPQIGPVKVTWYAADLVRHSWGGCEYVAWCAGRWPRFRQRGHPSSKLKGQRMLTRLSWPELHFRN